MKTARVTVEAVSIWCPGCGDFYPDPRDGSSLIVQATGLRSGQVLTCDSCGCRYRAPAVVDKL